MKRKTFLDWIVEQDENLLDEMGRTARYGGREDDDKVPFSMLNRMRDNDLVEGDWEAELEDLVMRWARSTGPAKEILKAKVDEYTDQLLQMGNSITRVMSILNRATHDQRGSFIKAATQSAPERRRA